MKCRSAGPPLPARISASVSPDELRLVTDDDDPNAHHYDDFAARDEWAWIIDEFRDQVLEHYPSAWAASEWIGREDRVVAVNAHARFGISEYRGCIAYWVVLRDTIESGQEGLAQRWFDQIGPGFEKRFATLTRHGTLSNGETVFRAMGG